MVRGTPQAGSGIPCCGACGTLLERTRQVWEAELRRLLAAVQASLAEAERVPRGGLDTK
jgi:hypothetical protein